MSWRQIPNVITCVRIVLVLPLMLAMQSRRYDLALALALAAAVSDALDGALARRFGWQTWLGAVLDPIADKLLLAACFVGLWGVGAVPTWLLLLVLGRDLVIVSGAIAWHALIGPLQARPTWLGKLATCAQIALALGLLVDLAGVAVPGAVLTGAAMAVAALTLASGLDYVQTWARRARRAFQGEDPPS